jgi:hypothetical protein
MVEVPNPYMPIIQTPIFEWYTPTCVMPPSIMSLFSHIPKPLGMNVLSLKLHSCCHIFLSCIMGFDIKIFHQKEFKPHAHTHQVVIIVIIVIIAMLTSYYFHNVTCYTISLLSRIHVNNANLLSITCTLLPRA